MKKLLFSFLFLTISTFFFAQTSFEKQIAEKSNRLNKANTANEYQKLFSEFSALTKSNTADKWKAYYFASLSLYKKADVLIKSGNFETVAETNALAYKYASAILNLQPKNPELLSLLDGIQKQRQSLNKH